MEKDTVNAHTAAAAATVKKKNNKVTRSKLKKTIKNVICKPDRDFWPSLTEKQSVELLNLIRNHKIEIPEKTKLHWSVLKSIPKSERPKTKRVQHIPGFIFGLSQCERLIKSGECNGVIIDSGVTPRFLVAHIIEAASMNKVPVVCATDVKKETMLCFGFPSCCIALTKSDAHGDIQKKVEQFWKTHENFWPDSPEDKVDVKPQQVEKAPIKAHMETDFKYLIRTSDSYRVFVPPTSDRKYEGGKDFSGQGYIKFSTSDEKDMTKRPAYKGMILKRVSSNPDRKKKK